MNKLLSVFILSFCIPVLLFAQTKTVKGKVTDEDGVGVPNANVVQVGGTRKGTQTDKEGNFSLAIVGEGKVSLSVSSVGYNAKVVNVTGESVAVILEKRVSVQDEVVVVGYQTIKRKEIAGAASAITAEQIKDVPASSNAAEALAGRATGVQVVSAEGGPGADYDIKVRGGTSITQDNTPLYIVDGIPVENALSVISPQDIQSFDILKDAAATAIYGSRGANGVIVITTKGGKNNKKISVTYNAFVGWKSLAKELDVMSPEEFVEYQYERIGANMRNSQDSSSFAGKYGPNLWVYGHAYDSVKAYANVAPVDWQDKLFGRKALQQSHNISISGGNKQTSFNLSLTYNKEDGILLGSDFEKKLATFKLEHKASNKLKLGTTIRYTNQALNGAGVSGDGLNFSRLRHTIKYVPFNNFRFIEDVQNPVVDEDGGNPAGSGIVNPLVYTRQDLKRNTNNNINVTGYAQYSITKWLTFKTTVGIENKNQYIKYFSDSATPYSRNDGGKLPIARIDSNQRFGITNSNVISFNSGSIKGRFKKNNNLQIVLGQETVSEEEYASSNIWFYYPHGADYNKVWQDFTGSYTLPSNTVPTGYPAFAKVQRTLLSFFGKATYSRKSKYFATFSYRGDGSSRFAPGRQWGYFPAGSLAWNMSKEKFMSKVGFISDVKLRASYGASGNNKIPDYAFLPTFADNTSSSIGYGLLDAPPGIAYIPNSQFLANQLIKWETTVSKNVGVDFGLFKNKLLFTVDLYENSSNDLLLQNRVPSTTGSQYQYQNVGSTVNRGIELQVTAPRLLSSRDFNWSSTFNISFNKNKVKSLGGLPELNPKSGIISTNPYDYKVRPGEPLGQIWGYVNDGFYTADEFVAGSFNNSTRGFTPKATTLINNTGLAVAQPGNIKFKDLDGNDTLDVRDQTVIGNTNPKFFGGLNNQFTYKNFDLSVFVNWVVGNDVYNANRIEFTNGYQPDANFFKDMEGRWKTIDENGNIITDLAVLAERNKNATIWRPLAVQSFNAMSWAVEDASFLRINNVTLGYTLKPRSKFIKSVRLYATGNNLAVITNYTGFDPEVSAKRSVLTPGVDYSAYPKTRSYIFGVNVGF
ncbi:TonB-dependent receptor [Ferruginibacter lapsinanis]|uniref:SusC/RagA family TonB-linked outer membrane protein n=1 Tax=Ferruginibacter lapsinanis TaxID=563172 RepID=UPI001E4A4E84|nr:TonB-dependent receptor [Ferruginibacter lapsinanis]UEG49503.1 TonB-dependent receptor [Ferruginibacter lapsinanis]